MDHIDVTIDGADEVDKNSTASGSGGAALLWEKIVHQLQPGSWIVDESKVVGHHRQVPRCRSRSFRSVPAKSSRSSRPGYKPVLRS